MMMTTTNKMTTSKMRTPTRILLLLLAGFLVAVLRVVDNQFDEDNIVIETTNNDDGRNRSSGLHFHDHDRDQNDEILPFSGISDFFRLDSFQVHMFDQIVNNSKNGGELYITNTTEIRGVDTIGKYRESITNWHSPNWPTTTSTASSTSSRRQPYFQTSIRLYYQPRKEQKHNEGPPSFMTIVFTQRYPRGTDDCGTSENTKGRPQLRSTFPNFKFSGLKYYSYHGRFLKTHRTGTFGSTTANITTNNVQEGIETGPILLFQDLSSDNNNNNQSRPRRQQVGILSHYNQFMTQSTVINTSNGSIQMGVVDTMCPLPPNFEASTILVLHKGPSIHNAVRHWGDHLRSKYMKSLFLSGEMTKGTSVTHETSIVPRRYHDQDYTTRYLGYSTDNGAYYYYHIENGTSNYEETLLGVHEYAKQNSIPYKYWLLDSWWYYQSSEKLHAVTNWTSRPTVFPHGMRYLYEQTSWKVQGHNRMWPIDNHYQHQYDFIKSEKDPSYVSLPTEYRFWYDLFRNATTDWELIVYEQDWLNVIFEEQSQAYTNVSLMKSWLLHMGRAAYENKIVVQYCMPLARHILQSVEIPSVTQARASDDYITTSRGQWNIGPTSLLYRALDLRPSKDNAWSMSNQHDNRYRTEEPYPEFQALILAYSTGPVAFSDKIGYSNTSLIMRTCRTDGMLLQPTQPFIPIHEWFYQQTIRGMKKGHIQESKMEVMNGLLSTSAILVLELEEDFVLYPYHLDTFVPQPYTEYVVYDSQLSSIQQIFDDTSPLMLQKSMTTTPGDYRLYFIAPIVRGWILLGERHKFVPLSKNRFKNVEITPHDGLKLLLEGAVDETTEIAYARMTKTGQGQVMTQKITIPSSGTVKVTISKEDWKQTPAKIGIVSQYSTS
jgi:hypothetical protein